MCFEHEDLVGRVLAGYDFVENDAMPQDENGHGCAIAGIIAAVKEVGIQIHIVVRLEGTNVDLGKKLLQTSGLNIKAANTLTEGATIATSLIKK